MKRRKRRKRSEQNRNSRRFVYRRLFHFGGGQGERRAGRKSCRVTKSGVWLRITGSAYIRSGPQPAGFKNSPGNEAEVFMVSLGDRVVVPQHVLVRFMDRESVLLNLETERYFGLDETGTRMWQVATSAPNVEAALRQLQDEYDAQPEILQSNLTELLGRLVENGLLSLRPADVGTASTV